MIPNANDDRLLLAIKEVAENNIQNLGVNYTEYEYRFALAIADAKQNKQPNFALYTEYEYRFALAVADVSMSLNPRLNYYSATELNFALAITFLINKGLVIKTAITNSVINQFNSVIGNVTLNLLTANTLNNPSIINSNSNSKQLISTANTLSNSEILTVAPSAVQFQDAVYQFSPRLGFTASNNKVSSLTDSINGISLTNNDTLTQPNLLDNFLDNKPVLEFGNNQSTLLQSAGVSVVNSGFYVFVINFKELISSRVFFDGISLNTYLFYTTGSNVEAYIDPAGYLSGTTKAVTENSWLILSYLISPSSTKIWVNGGIPSSSFSGFQSLIGSTLGARANGVDSTYCQIAELIIFGKSLSNAEHDTVGLNLKSIYPSLTWNTPS